MEEDILKIAEELMKKPELKNMISELLKMDKDLQNDTIIKIMRQIEETNNFISMNS